MVQPRSAPVPPSDPAPDELPDPDPEEEPEEPPDEDVEPDDEPDPEDEEPDDDPEEEPDTEPEDDPDEPEPDPPPPPSASFPRLPALLAQAAKAKAVASTGTPSNHRATMRASVGGRSSIHKACPSEQGRDPPAPVLPTAKF
jgi:hypothetical protein